ncbi:MAG TPA: glycine cleavage system aminomethyltransferase GcvT [Pirellulaceae bacterium]|nr:glycine cleavage system aminomethyltransferase GcvT [Pirellulaceae bacterium]
MSGSVRKTPLFDWHAAHGGRLVDFAGWSMPVQYGSIVEEHLATRRACGLFDVSHMGRLRLDGAGVAAFLDRLLTRKVSGMGPGRIRYSLVCNESGGILDDVLIYHLQEHGGGLYHLLVVNASNREKIVSWLQSHLPAANDVQLADRTTETAMIAVQGPAALKIVEPLVGADLGGLGYYTGLETTICGHHGIASRTGYTGEDGCELIVPVAAAVEVWEKVLAHGKDGGAVAAGLGARDTLRLEAAMPLYGHELSETINPIQAGLNFAVNLEGREFIGRSALIAARNDQTAPVRVGLVLAGRRVPREHYPVLGSPRAPREDGISRSEMPTMAVGEVTSGTFSPTLQKPIAMAYVQPDVAAVGTPLAVNIRGTIEPATVVKLPFYTRAS